MPPISPLLATLAELALNSFRVGGPVANYWGAVHAELVKLIEAEIADVVHPVRDPLDPLAALHDEARAYAIALHATPERATQMADYVVGLIEAHALTRDHVAMALVNLRARGQWEDPDAVFKAINATAGGALVARRPQAHDDQAPGVMSHDRALMQATHDVLYAIDNIGDAASLSPTEREALTIAASNLRGLLGAMPVTEADHERVRVAIEGDGDEFVTCEKDGWRYRKSYGCPECRLRDLRAQA